MDLWNAGPYDVWCVVCLCSWHALVFKVLFSFFSFFLSFGFWIPYLIAGLIGWYTLVVQCSCASIPILKRIYTSEQYTHTIFISIYLLYASSLAIFAFFNTVIQVVCTHSNSKLTWPTYIYTDVFIYRSRLFFINIKMMKIHKWIKMKIHMMKINKW